MVRAFISHATENKQVASFIKSWLAMHCHIGDVFVSSDRESIEPGEEWRSVLLKELDASDIFIVLLTPAALDKTWISFEYGVAKAKGKAILPLLIDGDPESYSSTVFGHVQFLNAKDSDFPQLFISEVRRLAGERARAIDNEALTNELRRLLDDTKERRIVARSEQPTTAMSAREEWEWDESVRVLHLPDLQAVDLPISRLLDILRVGEMERAVVAHLPPTTGTQISRYLEPGFDYVIVAGRAPNDIKPNNGVERNRLLSVLTPLIRSSAVDPVARVIFVGASQDDLAEIRDLGDLTVISLDYSTKTQFPSKDDLGKLKKQLSTLIRYKNDEIQYTKGTPTLLISQSPFILNESSDTRLTREIETCLRELAVTLHLYGKSPTPLCSHDAFLYQYPLLGAGVHKSGDRLRANIISIGLSAKVDQLPLTRGVWINPIEWQGLAWRSAPKLLDKDNSPVFVPSPPISAGRKRPLHEVMSKIKAGLAQGARYVYVNGFSGSGQHRLFAEFEEVERTGQSVLHGVAPPICVQLSTRQTQGTKRDLVRRLNQLKEQGHQRAIVVILDADHRDALSAPADHDSTLTIQLYNELQRNIRTLVVHIVDRIEDDESLKRTFESHGITDVEMVFLKARDFSSVEAICTSYSTVAPISLRQIKQYAGALPDIAETLVQGISIHYAKTRTFAGHRLAWDVAKELATEVANSVSVRSRCRRFEGGLGASLARRVLLAEIQRQLKLGVNEREPIDLESLADKGAIKQSLREAVRRLERYGLLETDGDDVDRFKVSDRFPPLVASRVNIGRENVEGI